GLLAVFGLVVLALCRGPRDVRQGWPFVAECALIVLGMLLFSERTWKHHAVTLLLPFAVLSYALFASEFGRRMKVYLGATLTAVGLLTIGSGLLPGASQDLAMVYGTHTVA